MKCIDLCNDTIKVTGIHFSYNKVKLNEKKKNSRKPNKNSEYFKSLGNEGKIIVFKTVAISKIVFFH